MGHRIGHAGNLHPRVTSHKQMTIFLQKNIDLNLLFCFTYYSLIVGLNNKMWCAMLTRIGLFIFEQFLRIGCVHMVIANGPAHCVTGELAGPDVTFYLQNHRLFWRILLKPDLAIGEAYMDGSLTIANDDVEQFMALLITILPVLRGYWRQMGWR